MEIPGIIKWYDGTRKPCVILSEPEFKNQLIGGHAWTSRYKVKIRKVFVSYTGRDGVQYKRWITLKRIVKNNDGSYRTIKD